MLGDMTQKDIRALVHFSPFKPFRLHLVDGKDLRVPHPDFALVTAEYVVVANELPGGAQGGGPPSVINWRQADDGSVDNLLNHALSIELNLWPNFFSRWLGRRRG